MTNLDDQSNHAPLSPVFLSGEPNQDICNRRNQRFESIVIPNNTDVVNSKEIKNKDSLRIEVIDEENNEAASQKNGENDCTDDKSNVDCPPPISFLDEISNVEGEKIDSKPKYEGIGSKEEGRSLMEEMMKEASIAKKIKVRQQQKLEQSNIKSSSFGMKKGFLSGSTKKMTKKNSSPKSTSRNNITKKYSTKTNIGNDTVENNRVGDKDDVFESDCRDNIGPLPKSKRGNEIETIRPKSSISSIEGDNSTLRFQEVQDAMANTFSKQLAQGQWATPDLMERITKNPRLMAGMMNPKFTVALEALQKNPKKALHQFQNHPEIMNFLREFCDVMGNHFTLLGEEEEGKEKIDEKNVEIGPLAKKALKKERILKAEGKQACDKELNQKEQKKLDAVMADQDLTSLLMDPNMQRVMQECFMPGNMQKYMQHPDYGPKLRKMIQAGLLQIA